MREERSNGFIQLSILVLITFSVLLSGLVGGWFYWFEWRPSQIKAEMVKEEQAKTQTMKDCAREAYEKADQEVPGWFKALSTTADEELIVKANALYRKCMLLNGLEAEPLQSEKSEPNTLNTEKETELKKRLDKLEETNTDQESVVYETRDDVNQLQEKIDEQGRKLNDYQNCKRFWSADNPGYCDKIYSF